MAPNRKHEFDTGSPRSFFAQRRPHRLAPRFAAWLCALTFLCAPLIIWGDVLYLTDGSTIRGSVVGLTGDTLTFSPAFGGQVLVPRSRIVKIVFSDSAGASREESTPHAGPGGSGSLSVVFKDNELSSKVAVRSKKNESQIIAANWIYQTLIADGDTVFSRVDSTMDKTVFKGRDKIFKNSVELEDMNATLEAGVYNFVLAVRNRGSETIDFDFDDGPLEMELNLDNVQIHPGRSTRITVGINKGRLRLGKPRFYWVR